MSNEKKIITWKDADQNLCTIAAYILHESMVELRNTQSPVSTWTYPLSDGSRVGAKFGTEENRTIFSVTFGVLREGVEGYTIIPSAASYYPAPQCWWSFQNLVRMKLKEARAELKANLYGQGEKVKTSGQSSRNAQPRTSQSKFGRQQERP